MKTNELKKFFEANNFSVHLSKQDGNQCAEVETWTEGGVNMIIWLNPFTVDSFEQYVKDFDVDEEIDTHRQDPNYKSAFSVSDSLEDFTAYNERIKEVERKLIATRR